MLIPYIGYAEQCRENNWLHCCNDLAVDCEITKYLQIRIGRRPQLIFNTFII